MTAETTLAAPGKYLTFALAGEEYGVPVLKVREIITIMDITAVPQMPEHVKGVINLRGKVIPIIDLRLKFGLPVSADTDRTCIVVVEVDVDAGRIMLGVIVDSVSDVLHISTEDVEATPEFGVKLDTTYIRGIAKIKGAVKLLLDLDRMLAAQVGLTRAA
ncbi:MAG TPA: chemotaxis protein CheW [Vicinamibacterales bacterium]|nr:chemotaxis protein CheW [Vicinamibacterales bacterium]